MEEHEFSKAVIQDDIVYLKELCEMYQEILLTKDIQFPNNKNVLHIAVICGNEALVTQFVQRLPNRLPPLLLQQEDVQHSTPLHYCKSLKIAIILIDAYNDQELNALDDKPCPPWRVKDKYGHLPVHIAAGDGNEDLALRLLSEEPDFLHYFGKREISKLFALAIEGGCKNIVTTILESDASFEFNDEHIKTLAKRCGESPAVLMIQRERDNMSLRRSVTTQLMFYAAEQNMVELIKAIMDVDISFSIIHNDVGLNFLHVAAKLGHVHIAHALVDKLNQHYSTHQDLGTPDQGKAWKQKDNRGYTPHQMALLEGHKEFAAYILSVDPDLLPQECSDNYKGESSLSLAMKQGMTQLVEQIISSGVQYSTNGFDMEMLIQFCNKFSKELTTKLIKQHPDFLNLKDDRGTNIFHYALNKSDTKVVPLLLEIFPSSIDYEPAGDNNLLIRACSKGNFHVICAISRCCPDYARCVRGNHDTVALHHVKHLRVEQCEALLDIPAIADHKNKIDEHRRTPLIKAIEEGNHFLAKALVKKHGTDVMNIKSKEQRCAVDMLIEKSIESPEWRSVYNDLKTKTGNFPPGTNLGEVQNTISLIAALLATITFAAAFTIPGGFDQNTGDVLLGKKVSLWVFLISDTYAMSCSMFILYSLVWTMTWDHEKAWYYINQSVMVLKQSLYGTLLAFVAGVYTMEAKKAFWLVILVIVLCSFIPLHRIYVKVYDEVVAYSKCKSTSPQSIEELSLISIQS